MGTRKRGVEGKPQEIPSGVEEVATAEAAAAAVEAQRKRGLMRLGLLMAITMTLHNLCVLPLLPSGRPFPCRLPLRSQ